MGCCCGRCLRRPVAQHVGDLADAWKGRPGTLYIRFAHEFNGEWYPWSVKGSEARTSRRPGSGSGRCSGRSFRPRSWCSARQRRPRAASLNWRKALPVMTRSTWSRWTLQPVAVGEHGGEVGPAMGPHRRAGCAAWSRAAPAVRGVGGRAVRDLGVVEQRLAGRRPRSCPTARVADRARGTCRGPGALRDPVQRADSPTSTKDVLCRVSAQHIVGAASPVTGADGRRWDLLVFGLLKDEWLAQAGISLNVSKDRRMR